MTWLKRRHALWRNLAHRTVVDRDLDDELRGTFDLRARRRGNERRRSAARGDAAARAD